MNRDHVEALTSTAPSFWRMYKPSLSCLILCYFSIPISLAWTDLKKFALFRQPSLHRPIPRLFSLSNDDFADEQSSQERRVASTCVEDYVARDPRELSPQDSGAAPTCADEFIALGHVKLHQFFGFPLDDWQLHAGGAICEGCNVIVCAPTGAGKTVVGEMALLHAFHTSEQGGIYTTPLKALSNQKYADLCRIFGRNNTGLSTGDTSINKGAQITVMTTEVYRNIAWRSSTPSATILGTDELSRNAVVVLD